MKNFGIKTKKFVRKITAIASAALMAGLSMGAAAADLSSLSSTFIANGNFNAYVVVGTGGSSNVVGFAKDVAGSIVVASAFAQKATTTTGSSGSAVLARNLTTGYVGAGNVLNISEYATAASWTNSVTGFSWLPNATVQNSSNADIANVTAKLSLVDQKIQLDGSTGKYVLSNQGLIYNLTFNSNKDTTGNLAIGNYTTNIPFPDGKLYQITNWTAVGSDVNISLGEYTEIKNLGLNSVQSVGNTGITFVISGATTAPKAQVLITDANGNKLVDNAFWAAGDSYANSTLGIDLRLKELNVLTDGSVKANFQWSTSSMKMQSGKPDSLGRWPNWTMKLSASGSGITSIAWVYNQTKGDSYISIAPDSVVPMLDGLFNIVGEPLSINSTDKISSALTLKDATGSAADVLFTDVNGSSHAIDLNMRSQSFATANSTTLNSWLDGISWTFKCVNATDANVTNGNTGSMISILNASPFELKEMNGNLTGYSAWINASWTGTAICTNNVLNATLLNFTTNSGNPLNTSVKYVATTPYSLSSVNTTSVTGSLTLTENSSNTVVVSWDKGDITSNGVTTPSGSVISGVGDVLYTNNWGTKLTRDSSSQVTLLYPEARVVGKLSIGQSGSKNYTLTNGQYDDDLDVTLLAGSGSSVTVNKIDVGLAMLDSEITSSTLAKPVILLGGSAVNSLVNELVSAGKVSFANLSANRALVQLVDNAFNTKSALVIAGWAGEDTRLAAQVVASQVLGTNMGLTGSSKVLNTGVSTYTDVTVI